MHENCLIFCLQREQHKDLKLNKMIVGGKLCFEMNGPQKFCEKSVNGTFQMSEVTIV